MKGLETNTIGPMMGGASAGGLARFKYWPQFRAAKYQSRIQNSDQRQADKKNNFGLGKNDTNICVVFLRLALDSGELSLYEQTRTTVYG